MFGKILRKVRMERGITQQKLADSIGIALRSYQCYEQGTREPPIDMLAKLADILDVSVDYLMERSVSPKGSVACAVPAEFHQRLFEVLIGAGISKDQIVKESNSAAVVGDGFIIENVSPKEAKQLSALIAETVSGCPSAFEEPFDVSQ